MSHLITPIAEDESTRHRTRPIFRDALAAPAWTAKWLGNSPRCIRESDALKVIRGDDATLTTVSMRGARHVGGDAFRDAISSMYRVIAGAVADSPHRHVVRLWNYLPGIHDRLTDTETRTPSDTGEDRYQWFNAGRFNAMQDWFSDDGLDSPIEKNDAINSRLPTASAIGHDGEDLIIHALSSHQPGVAIENPRQVPAFRYSRRFGPLPPCFSRATFVSAPRPTLLIAGTAAITGEDSEHDGDLSRQWTLTLTNLRALIESPAVQNLINVGEVDVLRHLRNIRIYVHPSIEPAALHEPAQHAFGRAAMEIDWMPATMCREELLVEIEANLSHD